MFPPRFLPAMSGQNTTHLKVPGVLLGKSDSLLPEPLVIGALSLRMDPCPLVVCLRTLACLRTLPSAFFWLGEI